MFLSHFKSQYVEHFGFILLAFYHTYMTIHLISCKSDCFSLQILFLEQEYDFQNELYLTGTTGETDRGTNTATDDRTGTGSTDNTGDRIVDTSGRYIK